MPTLGTPVGLPKVTARVDSQLKVTFGKLVSKSTHHVWQVDYLTVGVGLGLGLGLWRRADCSLNFSQKLLASLGNYSVYTVAQKVSHSQIIKTLCYIVIKSANEIRFPRQIKDMIRHYNVIYQY